MRIESYFQQKIKTKVRKIGEKYQLSLILVFGSFIKNKVHKGSDLDIAVLAKENLNFSEYSKLYSDFSEISEGQNVDLILINHADRLFLKQILTNCKLL